MINFAVCDDEKEFRDKITLIIDKLFIKNNIEYKIHKFSGYNKELSNFINNDMSSKIYLLDIEMKNSVSGIDIARKIRKNDWDSIIIMITSHSDLGYEALKAQIMLLDFISKFDQCEKNVEKILKKAIAKVDSKKVIQFQNGRVSHRLYLEDILYVTKDTVDRKCIIKTTYNEFAVTKTMNEMIEELGPSFYLSHRSCLVNLEKIKMINWKDNIIYFNNGEHIDLLARDKKKGLKEYVNMD